MTPSEISLPVESIMVTISYANSQSRTQSTSSDPREDTQRENVVSYLSLSPVFATVVHYTRIVFYMVKSSVMCTQILGTGPWVEHRTRPILSKWMGIFIELLSLQPSQKNIPQHLRQSTFGKVQPHSHPACPATWKPSLAPDPTGKFVVNANHTTIQPLRFFFSFFHLCSFTQDSAGEANEPCFSGTAVL